MTKCSKCGKELSHISDSWKKDPNNRYEGYLCGKCFEEEKNNPSTPLSAGTVNATRIRNKPELVDSISDSYTILLDTSKAGSCDNLNRAINVMAGKGWRCVNIAVYRDVALGLNYTNFYALMEKIKS